MRIVHAMLLLLGVACSGCTSLYFSAANLPTHWSAVRRTAGIAYGSGPRERLDVYVPSGDVARGRPLLVFFYGGAWDSGTRGAYRFAGTALAELGYVAVVPDYRVYPAVKFPVFLQDAARAVAWAQQHAADYGADPHRIVLLGHSAGAHMAAMLSIDPQYLTAAGVRPADIAGFVSLSGPQDLRPDTDELHRIFAAPYAESDWQVTARVRGRAPPALLLHGAADRRVRPGASELLAEKLRAAGGEADLKIYPDCSHTCPVAALSRPGRRQAPSLRDIGTFLQRISAAPAAALP